MIKLFLFSYLYFFKNCLSSDPSHFRLLPLNFYTPDNRNDKYFSNSNYYGVRIAWIASKPPSDTISISNNNDCIKLNWETKGLFNVHKNHWGTKLWDYAFIDTALPVGYHTITIDKWIYNVYIPRFGSRVNNDDTTFIIGDPNIGASSRWALGKADTVIKSKFLEYNNKSTLVVWLGDIFYHDTPNIITEEWPKLTEIQHNNVIKGVTNFLHIGIIGNHDYSSSTACHSCKWINNKNGLSCTNNNEVSAIWIPYFFATDAIKSFHNKLDQIYHRSCRVPYEYTLQVNVLGRTGYISIDNAWHPHEMNINWIELSNKINNYIDTILIMGHWDYINSGAYSGISDWISFLYKFFASKKIYGVQGHTHINTIQTINKYDHHNNNNINYQLITAGGNGFRGSGCDCKGNCFNCHCCCPTLYKNNNWIIGGWNNNNFCNINLHA